MCHPIHLAVPCRMCKVGIAALSTMIGLAMSLSQLYDDPVNYPATYLPNAAFPILFAALSAYFIVELLFQVCSQTDRWTDKLTDRWPCRACCSRYAGRQTDRQDSHARHAA
jgi:hypothetical protein